MVSKRISRPLDFLKFEKNGYKQNSDKDKKKAGGVRQKR